MINELSLIGLTFGWYDFTLKLASDRVNPLLGPVVCQFFSFLSACAIWLLVRSFAFPMAKQPSSKAGFFLSALAGLLIALALVALFFYLQQPGVKVSTAIPSILVLRNITLIIFSIAFLKEGLTPIKLISLLLCLIGILAINK